MDADAVDRGGTPARADGGERAGVVLGDRLCVRCGFNLHGQTIVREPHYGMLAVRCPECSAVASLQEYPLAGAWARRCGLLLAIGWAVAVLVLVFLTGLSFYAGSEGAAIAATRPAARQIGLAYAQYVQANQEPSGSGTIYSADFQWMVSSGEPADHWVDPDWLDGQDIAAVTATERINPRALVYAIPFALGMAVWGILWSVLLLHRRLRGRLIVAGLICAGVCVLVLVGRLAPLAAGGGFGPFAVYAGWGIPAQNIASHEYGLPYALLGAAIGLCGMAVGLMLGRKIARGLVRLLLPPHLRGPLAMLWHVDGLPSPPTRGEFWVRG